MTYLRRWAGTGLRSGPASPRQRPKPGPIHIDGVDGLTLCGVTIAGPAWRTVPERPQGDRGLCRRCITNQTENRQDRPRSIR